MAKIAEGVRGLGLGSVILPLEKKKMLTGSILDNM